MPVLNISFQFKRGSSADWANLDTELKGGNYVPKAGEPCYETDTQKLKIGDGVTPYKDLSYIGGEVSIANNHYEGSILLQEDGTYNKTFEDAVREAVQQVLGEDGTPIEGDTLTIKTQIQFNVENYSYTAYVYKNGNWSAMDGNYNAKNVYFDQDLLTTTAIGNITLENGQATIPVSGSNLVDAFQTIYVKENKDFTVTNPSVSLNGSLQYVEVGSSKSQDITVTYADGEYQYGYTTDSGNDGDVATTTVNDKTTGANATGYILMNGTNNITPKTEGGNVFTVASGIKTSKSSFSVKGSATYDEGFNPISNLKKMYPSKAISAGTTSEVSKELFRWYIPMYHGFIYVNANEVDNTDFNNISADTINSLTVIKDSTAYNQTKPVTATASKSWRHYLVAIPASYNAKLTAAKDSNNLTLAPEQANNVTLTLGTTSIEYNVFYIANGKDYDTLQIHLTW